MFGARAALFKEEGLDMDFIHALVFVVLGTVLGMLAIPIVNHFSWRKK